jgi:hypothetical protein
MAAATDDVLSCYHAERYCGGKCKRPTQMAIEIHPKVIKTTCRECHNKTELPRLAGVVREPFNGE